MKVCKHRVMDSCKKYGRPCIFSHDCFEPEEDIPATNADRIRAMSDEELAGFLAVIAGDKIGGTAKYWLQWLQQPAEEADHER